MGKKPTKAELDTLYIPVIQALDTLKRVSEGEKIGQDPFCEALSVIETFIGVSMRCLPYVSASHIRGGAQNHLLTSLLSRAKVSGDLCQNREG